MIKNITCSINNHHVPVLPWDRWPYFIVEECKDGEVPLPFPSLLWRMFFFTLPREGVMVPRDPTAVQDGLLVGPLDSLTVRGLARLDQLSLVQSGPLPQRLQLTARQPLPVRGRVSDQR